MKHLVLFEKFKLNEETNSEEKSIKPKMFVNKNGVLTIKSSEGDVSVQMKNSSSSDEENGQFIITTAVDQTSKEGERVFNPSVWRLNYNDVKSKFNEIGWSLKVLDEKGEEIHDSSKEQGAVMFVSSPKDYDGVINGRSYVIGMANNARRITGKGKTTWGFYNIEEVKKLSSNRDSVDAYKNVSINKSSNDETITPLSDIEVNDGFEHDSFELKDSTKKKLQTLANQADRIEGVFITTGASQDGDPNEVITKQGKDMKRSEWDTFLVKKRYGVLSSFLKKLGVKSAPSKAAKEGEELKVYGVFNKGNLKSEENRSIIIKPKIKS